MKQVNITISSCSRCPHCAETTIRCPSGRGFLMECQYSIDSRLIQRPDEEHGPFPAWCPLEDAHV
jgi:hypothetical protein